MLNQVSKFCTNFAFLIGAHELRNQDLEPHSHKLSFVTHAVELTFNQDLRNSCLRASRVVYVSRSIWIA